MPEVIVVVLFSNVSGEITPHATSAKHPASAYQKTDVTCFKNTILTVLLNFICLTFLPLMNNFKPLHTRKGIMQIIPPSKNPSSYS